MSSDPLYLLWHPAFDDEDGSGNVIGLNVTPGAYDRMHAGPRAFFEEIARDVGIVASLEGGSVLAYRSRYHGLRQAGAPWEEAWPINWRLTLVLSEPLGDLSFVAQEYFESYACSQDPPIPGALESRSTDMACVVLADFQSLAAAGRAQARIGASAAVRAHRTSLGVPTLPQIHITSIGDTFFQLRALLGSFPSSFFSEGAHYAECVEEICRAAGGITSFEERTDEWDEWDPQHD